QTETEGHAACAPAPRGRHHHGGPPRAPSRAQTSSQRSGRPEDGEDRDEPHESPRVTGIRTAQRSIKAPLSCGAFKRCISERALDRGRSAGPASSGGGELGGVELGDRKSVV